jgi:8-amino-7-oxononanoate synthase
VAEEKPEPREPVRIVGKDQFAVTDEDFATKAEGILERGRDDEFWKLTTSKLRGIYSLIMNIRTRSNSEAEFDQRKGDIQYLKVRMAYEAGVFITPVIAPAVPEKDVLIRFALMATHTIEQVDEAVEKLTKIFKQLEII